MLRRIRSRPHPRPIPPAFVARCRSRQLLLPTHWPVYSRQELVDAGASGRAITAAVRGGRLVRARQNAYLDPRADRDCIEANRVGGRLACVSELARWGVFVWDHADLHLEVPATGSRLHESTRGVRVHWAARRADGWSSVGVMDALVQAVQCQPVRAAIATLDSALHLGLIDEDELHAVVAALPRRLRFIRRLVDARAESGAETFMRLALASLPCRVEVQVSITGVGRVDFLVDGWLIVECDSEAFHSSWKDQRRDRRRDQAAASLGMATYRPIAEDIFWHPEVVVAALRGLLAMRDAVRG